MLGVGFRLSEFSVQDSPQGGDLLNPPYLKQLRDSPLMVRYGQKIRTHPAPDGNPRQGDEAPDEASHLFVENRKRGMCATLSCSF